jgi:hypothetical protein
MSSSASLLGYAIFSQRGWHQDCARAFVCTLPTWVPSWTKLLDEAGNPVGEIAKTWDALPNGKTTVRIRLLADALAARPTLRDDLLAHRVNIAVELTPQGRSLVLAPKIETERLRAGPAVVQHLFPWLAGVA